jgi:hypothetical protein|tara:strand:- start:380 stop:487 length:108 start_codon:yes stop_codon:yes gene_type:complete
MVSMSMGDDGMGHLPPWINIEVASRAIEAVRINFE